MIDTLITALSKELELSAEEIADTIWLALQIQETQSESTVTQKLKNDLSQPSLKSKELEGETLPETKTKTSDLRETTSKQSPEEQKAGIYPRNQQETLFKSELSFKVPDAPSLREPLTLARALKPLMRRIPSGTTLVLDEAATTQQIANEGLWLPVLRPTLEPWLDLELVVDEGVSMQIWRHTIRELERLLKNYGIFRDVRVWGLIADNLEQVQIRRGIGATAKNQSPRSPAELIDPSGRRLVLVVSDCVSSLWRDGKVTTTLEIWAKQGSMAIVQMLPKWLWKRTALGRASEVRLQGLNPGEFNQKLIAKEVSLWDELEETRGVKVPVFTLEPDKVANWAQMLSGKGSIWTSGYVFKLDPIPVNKGRELFNLNYGQQSAEQRVQAFRVTASPMARKLAGLLAAAPAISLPIVRLIQKTLLKDSQQVHVAEVFLGGLLKPLSEINAETNPDYVRYEFMDGVRELLVDSVPSGYVLNVVDEVSKDVAKNLGLSLEDFAAVLRNPQQVRDSEIAGDVGYFATVTAQVLRRLGGEYVKVAEELESYNRLNSQGNTQADFNPFPNIEYTVGGCLPLDSNSYIKRKADEQLYNAVKKGRLCSISAPIQMGKSSLILQTINRLKKEGFACGVIDLTLIGDNAINFENFCFSLIHILTREFNLSNIFNLEKWWEERSHFAPSSIVFRRFIEDVLLKEINSQILIFIDELDWLIGTRLVADFLMLLRSLYESQYQSQYKLKSSAYFILSGISTPYDLHLSENPDVSVSPFNIDVRIKLEPFTDEEALPLARGLEEKINNPQELLKNILEWTGGQPFLTQKLCLLVKESESHVPEGDEKSWLENLVRTKIIALWEEQDNPAHLQTIEHRILWQETSELLNLYKSILQREEHFDGRSVSKAIRKLMLTGLVVRRDGKLEVANKIYAEVFDLGWIERNIGELTNVKSNSIQKIDCDRLRNLLAEGKWKEADLETATLIFKMANREKEGWLRVEDIERFPSSILQTIDRLWVKYSNGKFGFSVQKRIYQGLGGTKEFNQEITESFWKKVGLIVNDQPYWSQYDNLTFNLSAPIGHLPIRYDVETPSDVLGVIEGILSRGDLDQDFASLELQTFDSQTIAVNSTYQIHWEGDILKVGYVDRNADGTAITANGDEIVRDAAARLQEMEAAGEFRGGDLLKIEGRIPVLVSYAIAHHVAHLYRAIAISDTRLNAYVVAISTASEYPIGSRIAFATGEVQQFPDNLDASPSFLIYWEDDVLIAKINNGVQVDGDQVIRDAAAQLTNLIDSGQLPGGKQILKIKGRTTVLASFAIASQVAHLYGGVAVFDPRLGEKGLDKYVVTVSNTQDFQVGETIDIDCVPQPAKVVLCGPANTGKTVMREALKTAVLKLENAPKDFYVISGCPDGDGSWFGETERNNPELAYKLRLEYKAKITPEFARVKARDISAIKNSLLLFDVGGKIPTEENRIIMSQATHAIMLARTEQDVADWQEFCEKELEKPLPFIAIVYSDFEGTKDTIVSEEPVLIATVHRLARDEDASNRPTVKALAQLLVNLVGSDIDSDFEGTKDAIGQIIKNETQTAQYFTENLPNNIPLEMTEIPGGMFVMGSPEGEGNNREKPQHEVIVQPFSIGKYLVTQAQWRAVTNLPIVNLVLNPEPSHYKGDNRPVENVSWNESVEFCNRLSLYTGKHYRLPSEAEWEYACRAGTNTPFHFGETLTPNLAIYASNRSDWHSVEYNSKNPTSRPKNVNNFGLFDMHGTLWEWCADAWHNNYEGAPLDGSIWLNENYKQKSFQSRFVVRGGSWGKPLDYCRSAYRDSEPSDYKSAYNGFRIVCVSEKTDNDKEEILQNILDGIITEKSQIFESLIKEEIHTFLIDRTINSLEIPDDNNEATITGVGEPYDIELESESTENKGRDSLFLIRFNLTVECELSYYIFKAEYYTIDDEKLAKISTTDWNEHYFRAEESYPLNVEGLISLKCDSRLLELSLISNEHLLAFLEKADISINEITQIEIN